MPYSLSKLHRVNLQPPKSFGVISLYLPQAVYYTTAYASVVYFDGYRVCKLVTLYQLLTQQNNVVRRFHCVLPLPLLVECHFFVYLVPDYRLVVAKTCNVTAYVY